MTKLRPKCVTPLVPGRKAASGCLAFVERLSPTPLSQFLHPRVKKIPLALLLALDVCSYRGTQNFHKSPSDQTAPSQPQATRLRTSQATRPKAVGGQETVRPWSFRSPKSRGGGQDQDLERSVRQTSSAGREGRPKPVSKEAEKLPGLHSIQPLAPVSHEHHHPTRRTVRKLPDIRQSATAPQNLRTPFQRTARRCPTAVQRLPPNTSRVQPICQRRRLPPTAHHATPPLSRRSPRRQSETKSRPKFLKGELHNTVE